MAVTTTALLQAAINTLSGHDVGSPNPITILEEVHDSATYSRWYVTGHPTKVSAPAEIMGERTMWCKTTISGNAAAQAAEVLAALESSDPSGTVTTDSNLDPDALA
jgi:hypothetical protein